MLLLRSVSLACALALAPFIYAQQDSCSVTLATVQQHIGEIVTFCGTPDQVSAPEKVKDDPLYLNFGGRYPHHTFSVVIWGDVTGNKREKLVKRFTGKTLRIKGWVKERDGKPTITVRSLDDISVE